MATTGYDRGGERAYLRRVVRCVEGAGLGAVCRRRRTCVQGVR